MRFLEEATELPTCKDSFLRHVKKFDEGKFYYIEKVAKATRFVGDRGEQARSELNLIEEEMAFILALGNLLGPYSVKAKSLKKEFLQRIQKVGFKYFSHLEELTQHYIQMINTQINQNNRNQVNEAMEAFRQGR